MAAKKAAKSTAEKCDMKHCGWSCNVGTRETGCIWFLGWIGASVYYVQMTDGFWLGVWGVIKALVWPAILVYHLLGL